MPPIHTPGSFTKNFSWNESYERLHTSMSAGFQGAAGPISRNDWRENSGIRDQDRELIPLNFFLYSIRGLKDDYVLIDQLVDAARDPYDHQFAQLALFAFHLAESGSWKRSIWPDGRVAGWANEFIKEAWSNDDWKPSAFLDSSLMRFIEERVEAEPKTLTKIFTNYRFMLRSAGVLVGDQLQPNDLRQRWLVDAVLLFWDRLIFKESIRFDAKPSLLEEALIEQEIYKLLRCSKQQCQALARAAFPEFTDGQAYERAHQISSLRAVGLLAA
jgi:hypothetical protein